MSSLPDSTNPLETQPTQPEPKMGKLAVARPADLQIPKLNSTNYKI